MMKKVIYASIMAALIVAISLPSYALNIESLLNSWNDSTNGAMSITINQENITGDMTVDGAFAANDDGGDDDCYIEGDTDTVLLYTDAGNDRVGISTNTPDKLLHVEETTALTNAITYPFRITHDTSGTPAANIGLGIQYEQETSASNNEVIMSIDAVVDDATAASEDASFSVKLMAAGAAAAEKFAVESTGIVTLVGAASLDNATSATELNITETTIQLTGAVDLEGGVVTVNNDSGDYDFTVESDGNAAAIKVDAGNDRVGIFTAAPTVAFDVTGASLFTGAFTVEGATTINDTSADVDTRIESNGNENAIFVDAGNDRVGVFTAAPTVPFDVTGNTLITGTLTTTGAVDFGGNVTLENDETVTNGTDGQIDLNGNVYINGATKYKAACTIAADDVTPDVAGCSVMITSANSGATAITDLDNPVVGSIIMIIGGSATNSSTIADSGNFNLSGAFTAGLDDVLVLYVQADNDYIELSTSDN